MSKLTDFLMRRRRVVLGVWIGVLLLAAPFAAKQTAHLTGGGFIDQDSDSAQVEREMAEFPAVSAATLAVVLDPQPGATRADLSEAVGTVREQLADTDDVTVSRGFAVITAPGGGPVGPVLIPFGVAGGESVAIDVAKDLRSAFGITETDGGQAGSSRVDVYLGGQGALWAAIQATTKKDVETAEIRAFPLIALVLLAAFGSLAAALLPLSLGIASVLLSGAFIYFLSLEAQTSVVVTTVASMLGLGIAVDYSLFILVRYREEIAAGAEVEEAIAAALSSSGVAVLISGVTVIASLAALFLIDSTAMRSIAAGAMFVVAVSVLVAGTFLPVLIRMLGKRVYAPGRLSRVFRRRGNQDRDPFWLRWSAAVMRRPAVSVLGATLVLVVLALPAFGMRIENTGLRQVDEGDSFRRGLAAAVEVAGPGGLGPVQVVVSSTGAEGTLDPVLARRVRIAVADDPGVEVTAAPRFSPDRSRALIAATLTDDPTSDQARTTVRRLRGHLAATAPAGTEALVGGTTASTVDFDDLISDSLLALTLVVLALSYLVLVPLLRSVVLPLKAVLMTMFSVAAGFGITVAIFQWGWLGFLGLDQAPAIDTTTPPLVIVIAFGLSMDYEVFMLSRIRERFLATGDTRQAVTEGLSGTARTITSAALIMVIVFLAFVTAGLPSVQRLGVAAAATIAIDATLVRLVLVPGLMVLLGRWNWWMPRPLAKLLPELELESR